MGLFSKLIGSETSRKKDTVKNNEESTAASTAISYDAGLVDKLKREHQELVHALTSIKRVAMEGHFNRLPDMLSGFKLLFLNHVGLENVKFYVYMQQHGTLDTDTRDFIASVRKEMNSIARAVTKFIDANLASLPSRDTVDGFNAEVDQIGDVLVKRVELEESRLYSLYQP